jgi:hypothetical protein
MHTTKGIAVNDMSRMPCVRNGAATVSNCVSYARPYGDTLPRHGPELNSPTKTQHTDAISPWGDLDVRNSPASLEGHARDARLDIPHGDRATQTPSDELGALGYKTDTADAVSVSTQHADNITAGAQKGYLHAVGRSDTNLALK